MSLRKSRSLLAGLCCVAALCGPASAQTRALFTPPAGFWLRPGTGVTTAGDFYGPTSLSATWVVSQWNTPDNLPPFKDGDSRNGFAHVHLDTDHSYTLEQDGQALSCDRNYATGFKDVHEFDLFVGPNNGQKPKYPQAVTDAPAEIGTMKHLFHRITLQPLSVKVMDTACPVTRTIFLTSITLGNPSAKQTLFYQLRLGIVEARSGGVVTALPQPFWFAKGHDKRSGAYGYYGYDDSITTYGDAAARVGGISAYSLDLLPRLTAIIREGAASGMDQDVSHWFVRGTYHGEVIWGHIHTQTHWGGFVLAAQP
jgi:hypothetical protein